MHAELLQLSNSTQLKLQASREKTIKRLNRECVPASAVDSAHLGHEFIDTEQCLEASPVGEVNHFQLRVR